MRRLVRVIGKSAKNFLNGLASNKIDGMQPCYTHFLNPRGRTLFESIIYPEISGIPNLVLTNQNELKGSFTRDGNEMAESFLVECNEPQLLISHLEKYRLSAAVEFEETLLVALPLFQDQLADMQSFLGESGMQVDPRHPEMPPRCILKAEPNEVEKLSFYSADRYLKHRTLLAIPEGLKEVEPGKHVALELNADLLHGISTSKGCYLGQELMSRTLLRGVIRKRLLPFKIKGIDANAAMAKLINKDFEVVSFYEEISIGLALCRLERLTDILELAENDLEIIIPDYIKQILNRN